MKNLGKRIIQSTELQRIKLENESKQKSVLKPNNAKAVTAEKCMRKRKKWQDIRNEGTKCIRLNNYKDWIISILKDIDMCKKADITIWLSTHKFQFSWSCTDGQQTLCSTDRECSQQIAINNFHHDHTYASCKTNTSEGYEEVPVLIWQKFMIWKGLGRRCIFTA